jgi:hypothetical protein
VREAGLARLPELEARVSRRGDLVAPAPVLRYPRGETHVHPFLPGTLPPLYQELHYGCISTVGATSAVVSSSQSCGAAGSAGIQYGVTLRHRTAGAFSGTAPRIRLGEYPSPTEARGAVRTHRRLVDEIAAGQAEEAQATARKHLAATQALVLARFNDDVVNATPARRGRVAGPS